MVEKNGKKIFPFFYPSLAVAVAVPVVSMPPYIHASIPRRSRRCRFHTSIHPYLYPSVVSLFTVPMPLCLAVPAVSVSIPPYIHTSIPQSFRCSPFPCLHASPFLAFPFPYLYTSMPRSSQSSNLPIFRRSAVCSLLLPILQSSNLPPFPSLSFGLSFRA